MNRIWFGSSEPNDRVWRGSIASEVFTAIQYDGVAALDSTATVFDIEAAPLGIYIGTNAGVTQALTGDQFVGIIRTQTAQAVLTTSERRWAAGRQLWDLEDGAVELNPWSMTDNDIRAMGADADGNVWIGSDTEGVVRIDGTTGANQAFFTTANGLPSSTVRSVAAETSGPALGDVWFA